MNGLYYISGSRSPGCIQHCLQVIGQRVFRGREGGIVTRRKCGNGFPAWQLPFLMPFGPGCQFGFFLRLLLGGFLFFFQPMQRLTI